MWHWLEARVHAVELHDHHPAGARTLVGLLEALLSGRRASLVGTVSSARSGVISSARPAAPVACSCEARLPPFSPAAAVALRTGRTALPAAGASVEAEVLRKAVGNLRAQLDDLLYLSVRVLWRWGRSLRCRGRVRWMLFDAVRLTVNPPNAFF